MRFISFASLLSLSAASFAAVPYSFAAGAQAKSAEVNANFTSLDSALQKKAAQSALEAANAKQRSDSAGFVKALLDSSSSLRKSKQDALGYTPVNRSGDAISGKLSIESGSLLLSNKSVNQIEFGFSAVAPPSVGVRSKGTKAIWFADLTEKYGDYATGVEDYAVWNTVPAAYPEFSFKWYGGDKQIMALDGSGVLKVAGYISGKVVTTGIPASNVADYVFEPGYKLASLSDVEAYTAEHKHLPEVPSATEIEKGGLDLAQMNLVLLKKVEELTLHAIAQQKQIDALTKKVDGL
jgi:hypothetical protein